ncbi:3-oxoacyl-ACP synthase III family protein [Flavobacterium pectinovorum]|uniref:Ketoacyl-ACP synthase III n=1 Tax=Flavobacterium pectinovorum TaxID=29533 RepID=A0A502EBI2_9FLAO|nr:ketoacyl-ACP synthase III [Flavobacterium pectinovorum]TPG34757.1 ketoacyl-ACP synthase III [Flavobacterium pectinovorum]
MNMRIIGSGSYIPEIKISNKYFENHCFLDENGNSLNYSRERIIEKFSAITGIEERRYAPDHYVTSDLAFLAAQRAIDDAGIDGESIDYIIVSHNFGDVRYNTIQSDILPSLASRVKNKLNIKNPACIALDIIFGCPGWIQGIIHANAYMQAAIAKRCLVIGAECLSRVVDPHDRDSMIYADGAGATIVELSNTDKGLLSHHSASFTHEQAGYLYFGSSFDPAQNQDIRYIKMHGRKIYEFALKQVPEAMKSCIEKAGIEIDQIKKILIHQANEKMDEAIVNRFYKLYGKIPPKDVMPMIIKFLGNSSVATIPTLYDLISKGELPLHEIKNGDIILFASVGAGMNINTFVYKV